MTLDDDDKWFIKTIISIVVCVVLFVPSIILTANAIDKHWDHKNCNAFGPVRWVEYNHWNWDCLVLDKQGLWLPKQQLRDVN